MAGHIFRTCVYHSPPWKYDYGKSRSHACYQLRESNPSIRNTFSFVRTNLLRTSKNNRRVHQGRFVRDRRRSASEAHQSACLAMPIKIRTSRSVNFPRENMRLSPNIMCSAVSSFMNPMCNRVFRQISNIISRCCEVASGDASSTGSK